MHTKMCSSTESSVRSALEASEEKITRLEDHIRQIQAEMDQIKYAFESPPRVQGEAGFWPIVDFSSVAERVAEMEKEKENAEVCFLLYAIGR